MGRALWSACSATQKGYGKAPTRAGRGCSPGLRMQRGGTRLLLIKAVDMEATNMNSLMTGYFIPTFQLYQAIRPALMQTLTDDDLGYTPGGANPTLGELCRELGEVARAY